tara:strand:+ start:2166 stop:2579 length:414 start_codon:yes stop_codon:yes gene_type:complete
MYSILISNGISKESSFITEGIKYFNEEKFDKSKFLFERDLVFDPKSELSYLYLAKIHNKRDNEEEEENNLNSVLLLNPQNEEAIYLLVTLKIKQSDYNRAKELIDEFILVCKSFCSKKEEIESKFKKLNPENEKSNN